MTGLFGFVFFNMLELKTHDIDFYQMNLLLIKIDSLIINLLNL